MTRLTRAFEIVTRVAIGIGALATLAFGVGLLTHRPLLYGEAEVLYEAQRLAAGKALYIDPRIGDLSWGPPPSRVYVTYPPLWSWLLSHLPSSAVPIVGRALTTAAWFVVPAVLATVVARDAATRRRAMTAAGYVAGIFVLALWATTARPDTPAVLLAGGAMALTLRRGRLDVTSAALFALAAWFKPHVVGMAAGAFVVTACTSPRALWKPALASLGVSAIVVALLARASDGAWLDHLRASLGQPLSSSLWLEQLSSRTAFVLPIGLTLTVAWRSRRDPVARLAAAGFVGALVVVIVTLAKLGSASNYWMETAVAAVLLFASAPSEALVFRAFPVLVAVAATWQAIATVGSVTDEFRAAPGTDAFLARVAGACGGTVVASDEPGIELALDHRVLAPAFQMTALIDAGKFPLALWRSDLLAPAVGCLVTRGGLENPQDRDHARYPDALRRELLVHFQRVDEAEGLVLYRLR